MRMRIPVHVWHECNVLYAYVSAFAWVRECVVLVDPMYT